MVQPIQLRAMAYIRGEFSGSTPPLPQGQKKEKIVILLMTFNIFVVSLMRFELIITFVFLPININICLFVKKMGSLKGKL